MTKNDIALTVANKLKIKQTIAKAVVQMTLDGMLEIVATEKRLELRNFGVFEVRTKRAHRARNPRTGETVMVPEKKITHFKPGLDMMARVIAASGEKEHCSAPLPTADTIEPGSQTV